MKSMYWFYRGQLAHLNYLLNRIEVLRRYRGYTQELTILNKTLDNVESHMEKHNPYFIKKGRNMVSRYGDQ